MPDKKRKPKRSPEEAKADRVYKHFKAIKRTHDKEFIRTRDCEGCEWSTWPHGHGYYRLSTTNGDWLFLARKHGLTVREVKDIVTSRRNWDQESAVQRHEQRSKYEVPEGSDEDDA